MTSCNFWLGCLQAVRSGIIDPEVDVCIVELECLLRDYLAAIMTPITQTLLVIAVALLVIFVSKKLFRQHTNLPPGPTAWPIIGCLHLLGTLPHKSLADLARQYGPVMSVQLGQKLCVVATSPDAAKEFLKFQDLNFSSRPSIRAAQFLFPQDIIFNGLTPILRHLRKVLVTELMTAKRFQASKYMRKEEIVYLLRTIFKVESTELIQVVDHAEVMSLNIATRMVFGKRLGVTAGNLIGDIQPASEVEISAAKDVREFQDILREAASCFVAFHPQDFFTFVPTWFDPQGLDARFRKLATRINTYTTNMINQHQERRKLNPITNGENLTLLDALLAQLENPEQGVTERHVRSVLWDALMASTESSSLTVEWVMSEVLRNPALGERARSEIDRVVGLERTVQEADLPALQYIQALVKESLRLHPPVPLLVPHQNDTATTAFGYNIPAKTTLYVNVWGISRDPAIWQNPLKFQPERFLEGAKHGATEFQGQHFEFIPFGSGRRLCPGMALGSATLHLQVATLLHAFDWSLPEGMTPDQLDMTEEPGVSMRKRDRLLALATPRLPVHLY